MRNSRKARVGRRPVGRVVRATGRGRAEARGSAKATLSCQVSQGMFSKERGVRIELSDGRIVHALVDGRRVTTEREPEADSMVEGRVEVEVMSISKDSAIVDLPQPALEGGRRLTVPKSMLAVSRT